MAQRLLVVAHAATPATRALVFGGSGELLPGDVMRLSGRVASWLRGPEEACQATAVRLGATAEPIPELRECDFGSWTGKALIDVAGADPSGLDSWLHNASATPWWGKPRHVDQSGRSSAR
jgi:broad specificity phosphatase PhoE